MGVVLPEHGVGVVPLWVVVGSVPPGMGLGKFPLLGGGW